MFTALTEDLTILTVAFGVGVLTWGFFRARPYGKLGILAWLQSVILMLPLLLVFGLAAAGIFLNLIVILVLLVASSAVYIILGNRVRSLKQDAVLSRRATAIAEAQDADKTNPSTEKSDQPEPNITSVSIQPETAIAESDIVPIPAEDLKAIQSIFGIDTFFATETIPYQEGAIFRGNLRGEPEETYNRLSAALQERLGGSEADPKEPRYRLFLVENQDNKAVVIVLPSSRDPQPMSAAQKTLAVVLLLVTIAACLESGGLMLGFDLFYTPNRIAETVPLAAGILAILAVHELGHWLMARRHQVRLSFPFFIPTLQIGSFGAITRFESFLPNRNVLFDVAFAGPAAGGLVSLTMLIAGLLLSHKGSLFQLPSQFFQGSILVGTLTRVVLRESLQQPLVDVHPLVVLGWLGLVITALNLMPVGQLDGGRIVQSIYGRKIAARTTIGTLIVLGLAALVNPLALYWAVLLLFLQRDLERPCLNELTEPDDARAALGLLSLFLMVTTLLPLTPSLAGRLGIGM
ncbi:MAG: site-2 protease family protein [Leptolyngbyaceae cyanobacterium RU_5_1]|nr:site-2 protease family protein [Leptolyngbyaceae cyanobacterium RU_5_1]